MDTESEREREAERKDGFQTSASGADQVSPNERR